MTRSLVMVLGWCLVAACGTRAAGQWNDDFAWRAPHPHDNAFRALSLDGDLLVAAGARGALVEGDLEGLRGVPHDGVADFAAVASGGGVVVAVGRVAAGDGFAARREMDGAWSFSTVARGGFNDVIRFDEKFIGAADTLLVSEDGLAWSPLTLPDIVAAYCDGTPAECELVRFTSIDAIEATLYAWADIRESGAPRSALVTSGDGATWAIPSVPIKVQGLVGSTAKLGEYLFVSTRRDDDLHVVSKLWRISEDGNPVEVSLPGIGSSPEWIGLARQGTKLLAVTAAGVVAATDDGLTWALASSPDELGLTAVVGDETGLLATDGAGGIWRWTEASGGWKRELQVVSRKNFIADMAAANAVAIVVGDHIFQRTLDGVHWEPVGGFEAHLWHGIEVVNGLFVALGAEGRMAYSRDGYDWTTVVLGSRPLKDVAYGAERWVVSEAAEDGASAGEAVHVSADLETWERVVTPAPIAEVAFGNGRFVAPGLVSSDGRTWQVVAKPFPEGHPFKIRYHDGRFWGLIAAHKGPWRSDTFVTSADGVVWTRHDPEPTTGLIFDYDFDPFSGGIVALHHGGIYTEHYISVTADAVHFEATEVFPEKTKFLNALTVAWGTLLVAGDNGRVFQSGAHIAASSSVPVNISSRSQAGAGTATQIAGFVIPAGGAKRVLIRGVGPALAKFGVVDPVADPVVTIFDATDMPIASNDNWEDDGQGVVLEDAFAQVGAFAFDPGALDAALLVDLEPGAYTVQVTGGEGTSLVEIYEVVAPGTGEQRLVNISTRAVTDESARLIGGVSITGDTVSELLVRAVGPGLAAMGVPGEDVLADPVIDVLRDGVVVRTIGPWSQSADRPGIEMATIATGAFALDPAFADAADVVGLSRGTWTFQVRSASGGSGVVLLEIYRKR